MTATAWAQDLPIIRDAEIEGLMRLYTRPLLRAAGLNPDNVHVFLLNDSRINAFAADGSRIFITTGLLQKAATPNMVIGVLAHEIGHLAGGHLARRGLAIEKASNMAIISMLLGVATVVGGAVAGQHQAGELGQGIMLGGQGAAQRSILSYVRAQESSADQAAVKFLNATHQSGKGMLDLFYKLSNESLASAHFIDPYTLSHPMPLERVRNLERLVKASPYYNAVDPPALVLRHKLMQAKLDGFLNSTQEVYRKYPKSDHSAPALYARAIAAFRIGDIKGALPQIDELIRMIPPDPYFRELKGQALLENGKAGEALVPLRQAVKMLPQSGLIRLLLAQALLAVNKPAETREALKNLILARQSEPDHPKVHLFMATAYARQGNIARAQLETAEAAYLSGDKKTAAREAKAAQKRFSTGSPEWLRANDILNYTVDK
jgi:predicted Zn-dependent protease